MKQINQNMGLGIDIEAIERFSELDRAADEHFLKSIFTDAELDYCFGKDDPAPHLAARFSAKEAGIKALGSLGLAKVALPKIEISNDETGAPAITFSGVSNVQTKVSLSHDKTSAVAAVIIFLFDK